MLPAAMFQKSSKFLDCEVLAMKKKVICRTLLGFPLGVFISTTITMLISIGWGNGHYSAVVPELTAQMGSELNAFTLQYFLSGILGAACGGGACIWEMGEWSLFKRTLVYLIVLSGSMFPIAWFSWWMPHSIVGALSYIAIFLALFAVIFAVQYFFWKIKLRKMNDCLKNQK